MRIPLSWLAEYVDVPDSATPADVAADLVKVGLEEEGFLGSDITGPVVVGRVISQEGEKQKNGKIINWCQVDVGRGEDDPQGIVCGAHNFKAGDLVVAALPGAVLPGGFAISPRKTYGHVSDGMLCSPTELGLGTESDGIIVLAEMGHADATPGANALELLGLAGRESQGVEINVTPDRGYCFSIRGVAREYAHARQLPVATSFKDPIALNVAPAVDGGYPVTITDCPLPTGDAKADQAGLGVQGCNRFVARVVKNIDSSAKSPDWMRRRLEMAGMRSISLVVDVTNYVMLATGQPLHAYDMATLHNDAGLTVRRAAAEEKLETLDGQTRSLHAEDLVIADGPDGKRVVGIAGVMGGAATEVGDTTETIVLEAAHFDAVSIARSARRHKLPSEASKRFERGVDPTIQEAAAQLAVDLLVKHGNAKAEESATVAGTTVPGMVIDFDVNRARNLVGTNFSDEEAAAFLTEIGCQVSKNSDSLEIVPPPWRPDLLTPADLTEEVARLYGYDKIEPVLPQAPLGTGLSHAQKTRRHVADALASYGLTEVITYPFTSLQRFDDLQMPADDPRRSAMELQNPLNAELPLMRPDLLPTMMDVVPRNHARGAENVSIFEVARVTIPPAEPVAAPRLPVAVRPSDEEIDRLHRAVPQQPWRAAGILTGQRVAAGWQGEGRAADWADAIDIVRSVAALLGVNVYPREVDHAPFHPGRCAEFISEAGALVGYAGELHPKALEALSLPARSAAFELDLDVLAEASDTVADCRPLSNHSAAKEDIALIVDESVPAAGVIACLNEGGGELLESVRLFDVYRSEQIGEGKKSLAFALLMRASNRTLTASETARVRGAAVALAQERYDAVLRDS